MISHSALFTSPPPNIPLGKQATHLSYFLLLPNFNKYTSKQNVVLNWTGHYHLLMQISTTEYLSASHSSPASNWPAETPVAKQCCCWALHRER